MSWRRALFALSIATALLSSPPAPADTAVPQTKSDITFSFAPVVKKAAPAVVNIYTKSRIEVQQSMSPFMSDPFFRQFFGGDFAFGNRPRQEVISSLGSGVIIKSDGMIVTSYHVVKNAQEIKVALADKREFPAKVMLRDTQSDLAFLKINAPGPLPYLEMRDSDTLEVGDLVLAIGNPFGVGQTVTNGIVSALARAAAGVSDYQYFIQTDAPINPGNSGGALVDMEGRLIGINTAIYTQSGGSNGIGFAIPANMVRSLLHSKVEGGRVVRPWMGVAVQPVTPEIADAQGLSSAQGVMVAKVASGSPAAKNGIKEGDIILAMNGEEIDSEGEMQYRLALLNIGDRVTLKMWRGGQPQTIDIMLAAPPEGSHSQITLQGRTPLNGVTLDNLSPALALKLGLDEATGGVAVTASSNGAFAPGDILLSINGVKIVSTAQVEPAIKTSAHHWQIVYQHEGSLLNLTVSM